MMKLKNTTIALAVLSAIFFCGMATAQTTDKASVVMDNILTRASVRNYQDRPVEQEKVDKLLRAGMAAPSAVNAQPWHFVVVNDKNVLAEIAERTHNAGMAAKAPLAIVVCGDMNKAMEGWGQPFWIQDASAATENILLAANAMGLGAVWTGTYPSDNRVAAIREILKLPANLVPLNTIVIGYPEGEVKAKDKFTTENISYNFFGGHMGDAVEAPAKKEKTLQEDGDAINNFHGNPFNMFKGAGLLLCAGDKTGFNEMTIGWGSLGNIWGRGGSHTITVYVANKRYTHEYMEKTKYFTVMTFDKDHEDVLDYMGSHSGRDGDKVKACNLHTLYTENGTPYFAEASQVWECKMIYHAPFDPVGFGDAPKEFYSNKPGMLHSMYIGQIVKVLVKK